MRASSCSAVLQCTSAFHPSGAQHSAFCCTGHQECSTPAADFYTASLMIRHMPLEQPAASCHPVHQHQQQCHTCGSNMNTPRQHSSFVLTDIIELAACPICMRQASTTHCASVCNCRHLVSQPLHLSRTIGTSSSISTSRCQRHGSRTVFPQTAHPTGCSTRCPSNYAITGTLCMYTAYTTT